MKKIIVVCLILLFGCQENGIQNVKDKKDKKDVSMKPSLQNDTKCIEKLRNAKTQNFEFNSNEGAIFKGKQGTIISFPKNCFDNYNGIVKIHLIEVYDISTMVSLNLSTVTQKGELLETGGMIYVEPRDIDGNKLKIKKKITIEFPNNKKIDMKLFHSDSTESVIKWDKEIDPKISSKVSKKRARDGYYGVNENNDTIYFESLKETATEEKYLFETLDVGWLNCDRFLSFKNTVSQNISPINLNSETTYFLIFEKFNILVAEKYTKNATIVFKNLPEGEKVYAVSIYLQHNQVQFGIAESIISHQKEIEFPVPNIVSYKEFEMQMKNIFSKDIWSR